MPYTRKNAPSLTQTDLKVKRLIEHRPATVADIAHILQMTTAQVKAVLEKLEQANAVFHIQVRDRQENGAPVRRNYYLPNRLVEPNELSTYLRQIKRAFNEVLPTLKGEVNQQTKLMQEVDKLFNLLYTGLAAHANRRKDSDDDPTD